MDTQHGFALKRKALGGGFANRFRQRHEGLASRQPALIARADAARVGTPRFRSSTPPAPVDPAGHEFAAGATVAPSGGQGAGQSHSRFD